MKGSCDLNHTFDDLRQPKALNSYGQVLISQFIGKLRRVSVKYANNNSLIMISLLII